MSTNRSGRHEGKTMLVTGAAGAIGYATSEILAREGAQVMLVDINAEGLEQRVRTLSDAGYSVIGHHADCADEQQQFVPRHDAESHGTSLGRCRWAWQAGLCQKRAPASDW